MRLKELPALICEGNLRVDVCVEVIEVFTKNYLGTTKHNSHKKVCGEFC